MRGRQSAVDATLPALLRSNHACAGGLDSDARRILEALRENSRTRADRLFASDSMHRSWAWWHACRSSQRFALGTAISPGGPIPRRRAFYHSRHCIPTVSRARTGDAATRLRPCVRLHSDPLPARIHRPTCRARPNSHGRARRRRIPRCVAACWTTSRAHRVRANQARSVEASRLFGAARLGRRRCRTCALMTLVTPRPSVPSQASRPASHASTIHGNERCWRHERDMSRWPICPSRVRPQHA